LVQHPLKNELRGHCSTVEFDIRFQLDWARKESKYFGH